MEKLKPIITIFLSLDNFLYTRSIKSTEIYITLERTTFDNKSDDFTVRIAKEFEEIKKLLEVGFEFVCEKKDLVFLRKRK